MMVTGFPFLFRLSEQPDWMNDREYTGLCCLLDRAQYYGGENDVLFLCLHSCSALLRITQEDDGSPMAVGLRILPEMERRAWLVLPSLLYMVLNESGGKPEVSFHTEDLGEMEQWLGKQEPELFAAVQAMRRDAGHGLQPYSVGFTHISPRCYGENNIRWYSIGTPAPERKKPDHWLYGVQRSPRASELGEDYEAYQGVQMVQSRFTHQLVLVWEDAKKKLGHVDDLTEWIDFEEAVEAALDEESQW